MDELLIRVLTRLLRVHDEFGEAGFEDAAHRALVAIALTAKCEAERKAGTTEPYDPGQRVVRFPLNKRRRSPWQQSDDDVS
ncbi:hypothetical protein [Devosia sp. RR2S18]|uniref:hypothetical protein n=1 Tax=Devosia rhizosphaerae TaxID=3049774 RepID=UPI00254033AB|nr:hypothetical protein [Devosia sp. RR2S18]WIJ25208.1 hypothetical protein QOV41_00055 [Devosia sp. RR2S18]